MSDNFDLTDNQKAALSAAPMPRDELENLFRQLANGGDTIPMADLCRGLMIFGGSAAFTPAEIEDLKKEVGCNDGDQFDYKEFLRLRDVLLKK